MAEWIDKHEGARIMGVKPSTFAMYSQNNSRQTIRREMRIFRKADGKGAYREFYYNKEDVLKWKAAKVEEVWDVDEDEYIPAAKVEEQYHISAKTARKMARRGEVRRVSLKRPLIAGVQYHYRKEDLDRLYKRKPAKLVEVQETISDIIIHKPWTAAGLRELRA